MRDGDQDIFSISPNGSKLKKIVDTNSRDGAQTLSPDGKLLAFTSNRSGDFELYLLDLENDELKQLTSSPGLMVKQTFPRMVKNLLMYPGNWATSKSSL